MPLPSDADLRRLVHFSVGDGRIWLAGQRMLLVHAQALGGLRRELMQTIGREQTRRVLMRAGYASGQRDAALARQVRPDASVLDQFAVGPQLHMLEGAVQVTLERFEMDLAAGHHHCLVRWDHSWEVETHVRDFGPQDEPVCWMLIGYASGYVSAFMGRPVIYRETECSACGHRHCRVEGRPVEAWPDGEQLARDYDATSLLVTIEDLQSKVESLRSGLAAGDEVGELVGRSRSLRRSIDLLRKAAPTMVTVLLTGESGVGKERFARTLHALGGRVDRPWVAINCASVPSELIDSELFGAERPATTAAAAATPARPGRIERAHGGTLFIDDITALPLAAQSRLLRVLQQGELERTGTTPARKIDLRLIVATQEDLATAVAQGRLLRDLMYRLSVFPIPIAPLRERQEDIELLAHHMLAHFRTVHGKPVLGFSDRALDAMRHYDWPGNVRELENLIERGVILTGPGQRIDVDDLFTTPPGHATITLNGAGQLEASIGAAEGLYDEVKRRGLSLEQLEAGLIQEAVRRQRGNLAAAARAMGLTRPQLSYRLRRMLAAGSS